MLLPDPTPTEAADIVAISALAAAYSEAICRFAIDEAVQVYTHDGVLVSSTTPAVVGRDAIAAVIRTAIEHFGFIYNTTHAGPIHVEGDRARARFPVTEVAERPDGSTMHFLGTYDDELVRTAAGWRFTRRSLHGMTMGRVDHFRRSKVHPIAPPTLIL